MLRTIEGKSAHAFRKALGAVTGAPGHQTHTRTLTTPGGPIRDAKVQWWPDPGLWAYLSPKPHNDQRWLCWYGVDVGTQGRPLQPAIEINLAVDPAYKQVSGRALIDPRSGDFFLGHRGGLGGGRGGQMTVVDFAEGILSFAREPIILGEDRDEEVFVIGALNAPDFRLRLKDYVAECVRLRAKAKSGASHSSRTGSGGKGAFKPEYDQDGFQTRSSAATREIRRRHGRVVNALAKQLGPKAVNSSRSMLRPDLYLTGSKGEMTVLFEVKANSDTQSWFTALGQLVVYGANENLRPRRVLVCPFPMQDPAFKRALKELGVQLVTFTEDRQGAITFENLAAQLP